MSTTGMAFREFNHLLGPRLKLAHPSSVISGEIEKEKFHRGLCRLITNQLILPSQVKSPLSTLLIVAADSAASRKLHEVKTITICPE